MTLDEAVVAFQHAIALDPNHANAHNNLGVVLRAQGEVVAAEAAYRAAIRLDSGHSDAYTNLGLLLHGQKRTHEAVLCFCSELFQIIFCLSQTNWHLKLSMSIMFAISQRRPLTTWHPICSS